MGAIAARPEGVGAGGARDSHVSPSQRPWAAFRRFLRGCQHAMLYPPDHQEFGAALQRVFDGCRELLSVYPRCTIEVEPLGLMGEPCPSDPSLQRFVARLQERAVPAITFLEGTTKQELLALVDLLKADPLLITEQGGAEAWLRAAGVERISLDPPRRALPAPPEWEPFLAAQGPADQDALRELFALCPETTPAVWPAGETGEGMAGLTWLTEALSAALAESPPHQEEWLRQAASAVRALTAGTRGKLFRTSARPDPEVLGEIAALLSPEEAAEILVSHPNAVVGEPSEQLEAVLLRVMPDPDRIREVEPRAKARLFARGMTEESYQSVVSLALRRNLAAAVQLVHDEKRSGEVRRLSLPTDLLATTSTWAIRESRIDMLLELAATAGEWEGKRQVVQELAAMIPASLPERDDAGAVALICQVEEMIALGVISPDEKRLLRAALAEACLAGLCRRLAQVMLRQPSPRSLPIIGLLSQAPDGLIPVLQIAVETPLPWLQGAAGAALVRMGERAMDGCCQRLSGGAPEEAIALSRALALSGTREGLEWSLWAQRHPDRAVAVGLMEALALSPDRTAERVLIGALQGGPAEIQAAAARSLGQHPSDEAIAALGALLSSPFAFRRKEVAVAALASLGRIGRADCVPILVAALRRRHLLSGRHRQELQAQAAQALAAIPYPSAEQALREEAERKSDELSAICAQALEARRSARTPEARGGDSR